MRDSLYIAWRYVTHNRARTGTLVACVTLIGFLPLALEVLLDESERQLLSRAESTPLVVGAKGSALDLVMNTLYFDDEIPEPISLRAADEVAATGLALPIPVYARFRARSHPIVGTSLDYFAFRGLRIARGRQLALLGEAVIGAVAAERLGLEPGDHLVSSPETVFDLAGVYPLKMHVVGVLARAHSPDDLAVFVDTKTAWVIQGLGHGHQDVTTTRDPSVILARGDGKVVANAKLVQFTEITPDNIDSFHFHGGAEDYPLSAVIAVPDEVRAGTLLRGRYLEQDTPLQILRPRDVIEGLLENIFRIKQVLDAVIGVVGLATLLAIVLVFALSLRLRQREIDTIFKLGCSRGTIAQLLAAEIVIIVGLSAAICLVLLQIVDAYSGGLVRSLFL